MQIFTLIKTEFYTEGPAIDKEGNIFFTTLYGGKIMKIDTEGNSSIWAETACPNGQRILSNGEHLVCDSQLGSVIRFNALGKKISDVAFGICNERMIRTPNDLVVDDEFGFYFTDSVRHDGSVFFFGNDGSKHIVASNLDYPNGICLSQNKTKLFISESYRNRILAIDLKAPGIPDDGPRIFCELPYNIRDSVTGNLPDGIMTDSKDRLWVAHYGMRALQLISRQGSLVNTFNTDIPLTSNLCFVDGTSKIVVTGGSGEPGPGNVHLLVFSNMDL